MPFFCLWVSVIFPTCSLYPQQKRAYSALHPQAWTYIYTGHACRHLPSAVPWISEDRLLYKPWVPNKVTWWPLQATVQQDKPKWTDTTLAPRKYTRMNHLTHAASPNSPKPFFPQWGGRRGGWRGAGGSVVCWKSSPASPCPPALGACACGGSHETRPACGECQAKCCPSCGSPAMAGSCGSTPATVEGKTEFQSAEKSVSFTFLFCLVLSSF